MALVPVRKMPVVPLPQFVYDWVADPEVRAISVPYGRYALPDEFAIHRPNLFLRFNGSHLHLNPLAAEAGYIFYIYSEVDPHTPTMPLRQASHLTGTIVQATTQLTMHVDEVVDVVPGEVVKIAAGVNTSDPVEPAESFFATVLTVVGQTITFSAPLGVDIPVYANEAALLAVVTPGQEDKVGTYGVSYAGGSNYKKGLGTDHGLLRFVGGVTHDVTVRDFHLEIPMLSPEEITNIAIFYLENMQLGSILNWSSNNLIGPLFHTDRCDDVLVQYGVMRGEGRALIFEPNFTYVGTFMTAWAGHRLAYKDIDIQMINIALSNTEASVADVLFQRINYEVDFDNLWTFVSTVAVWGFFSGSGIRIEDSSFAVSGTGFDYDPNSGLTFENLVIVGPFADFFNFALHTIEGTITVDSVEYGPSVVDTETVVRTSGSNKRITLPNGFYSAIRFRVTDQGSATTMGDGFGNTYDDELASGAWTIPATNHWLQVGGGAPALASYLSKLYFQFNFDGGTSVTIEFEITYLPAPDDAGWVLN